MKETRIFRLLVVSAIVGLAGFVLARSPVQEQDGLTDLQQKRIALLEERVTVIRGIILAGRAGGSDLIQPEMDVINARLDYAESNVQRKELLGQLLGKYDLQIEITEARTMQGVPLKPGEENEMISADTDLLFLQSERIRVQILLEALE